MLGTHVQNVAEGETEAREDEVILLKSEELFGEELELTPSSAMWLGALSLSTHASLSISACTNSK